MTFPVINVAVDFENNGSFLDVSQYVRSIKIRRGSTRVDSPLVRYEAGTSVLTLVNSDRRFDPTNLAGPYVSPESSAGSGVKQFQANQVLTYGHGFTVAVAATDPETAPASLRSTASVTSSSTSFTCGKPSGTASGDIMVAFQSSDWGSASGMTTPTGGASWTLLAELDSGTNVLHTKIWWKVAGGSEPSTYGFTQASSGDAVVGIATLLNATGSAVFDGVENNGTAFFDTPSITPIGEADYELRWVAGTSGTGVAWTSPSGYTEAIDAQSSTFTAASLAHASLSALTTGTGGTLVKPMRPVRNRAIWNGTTYDLFRGYVDSWDIEWIGPNYSEVTAPCTDAFKIFANYERAGGSSVGSGEASGTRIGRILDGIGWSASDRDIDTGDIVLQATTLDGNVLEEMLLVSDTEVGELYMTGDGKVFFRDRSGVVDDTRSNTSQATFGDGGGSELPYSNLTFSNDDTQMANHILITRVGGTQQVVEDAASRAEFLTKSFERSDLLFTTDAAALNMAQWVLSLNSQPELRFETITINPRRDEANLFPQVLNRQIGDRITIRRRPPGGGDMIEQDVFIRGIEHTIEPEKWETVWTLQSTGSGGSVFIIGNSTLGKLDSNSLGF